MIFDSNVKCTDIRLALTQAKQQKLDGICITSPFNKIPKTDIIVKKGAEIEFEYDLDKRIALETSKIECDYVVNTVKTLEGARLDDFDFYKTASRNNIYQAYLEKVFDSLDASFDFSVLGNICFVSKYANYPLANIEFNDFPELLEALLMRTVYLGKGLEIDTSLASRGILYPSVSILQKYALWGGEIITLSAHNTTIGKGIKESHELLKAIGFKHFSVFTSMRPEMHVL